MTGEVELSIVIAASWSADAVGRTVASFEADDRVEVIVASDPSRVAPLPMPGQTRWIVGNPGDGVPRLRRLGADRARGRVVAFLEDACVVAPAWSAAIRGAFLDESPSAATGPVLQAVGASATDWAVFFSEYASFLREGTGRLAGINFAVRRDRLGSSREVREAEVSARLAGSVRFVDEAAVVHVRTYGMGEAAADRWRFGREFGRDRWLDRPGRLKQLGLLAAPAILAIQLGRLARCVLARPRLVGPLFWSSPQTLAMLTCWSVGEALGWSDAGRGGSPRRGREARRPA